MKSNQTDLFNQFKPRWQTCDHEYFETLAYNPSGLCCAKCWTLLWQYVPYPPEVLGYESALWKHHKLTGKFTTQEAM
jgi:hypothetical protein